MSLVKDDELGWKPTTGSNWMTTGQLLMHMTNACGFCCRGFLTGDWGMPEGVDPANMPEEAMLPPAESLPTAESVAQARAALEADRKIALESIETAGEERLDGEKMAAPWEPENQRLLGEHFLGMTLHLMAHKNQLFYYLKLQGKDVNTKHMWGM